MEIHVDRSFCQLHGNCVATAPDLFWFSEDGELEYSSSVPSGQEAAASDAQAGCPMFAIEVRE